MPGYRTTGQVFMDDLHTSLWHNFEKNTRNNINCTMLTGNLRDMSHPLPINKVVTQRLASREESLRDHAIYQPRSVGFWDWTREIYTLYQIYAERRGRQTIIYRWQFLTIKSSVDLMKPLGKTAQQCLIWCEYYPLPSQKGPTTKPPPARNTLGLPCVV